MLHLFRKDLITTVCHFIRFSRDRAVFPKNSPAFSPTRCPNLASESFTQHSNVLPRCPEEEVNWLLISMAVGPNPNSEDTGVGFEYLVLSLSSSAWSCRANCSSVSICAVIPWIVLSAPKPPPAAGASFLAASPAEAVWDFFKSTSSISPEPLG